MGESNSVTQDHFHDKLLSLTKRYIENLSAARDNLANHAEFLMTVLDSVADGLIVFDMNETIILANRAAINLAGWDMQQLSRTEFMRNYRFVKDDGYTLIVESEQPYAVALRERRSAQLEGLVTGSHLPAGGLSIRAHAAPIISDAGELLGVVTIFEDISERKKLQSQRDVKTILLAHDLKNHLDAEALFLDRLLERFADKLGSDDLQILSDLKFNREKFQTISSTLLNLSQTI